MNGLARIHVEGFRSLRDVTLQNIGRTTLIIGPNGAGKSNLLAFFRMVSMINTSSLGIFVGQSGGASKQLYYGSKRTPSLAFGLELEQEGSHNAYEARLGAAADDTLIFLEERVGFRNQGEADFRWTSLGAGHSESKLRVATEAGDTTAESTRGMLNRINFFHFHDTSFNAPLRTRSHQSDDHYLRSDGQNLAAYLLSLRDGGEKARPSWRRIQGLLQRVAPFIKELLPTKVEPMSVRLDWKDENDWFFGVNDFSDGTLRALALITAFAQPASKLPLFVSVDEPELGLHPAALTLVCELIRSVSDRCQTMLATQSPALLDHFEPHEILVAQREAGATRFTPLDAESLKSWLVEYKLSDLFDKNLLGGRP